VRYVQGPLALPVAAREPILACGAGARPTLCLADGGLAWISPSLDPGGAGDAGDAVRAESRTLERELGIVPEVVAHDGANDILEAAHPFAHRGLRSVGVQHHHAHMAALLGEHAERGEAVVAVLDGGGIGTDGTIWGGELLVGGLSGCERRGLLFPVRMPGGTDGTPDPWKMACSWMAAALERDLPPKLAAFAWVDDDEWALTAERVRSGVESPLTTSAGWLLETIGAMCGAAPDPAAAGRRLPAGPIESIRASGAYPLPVIAEGDAPLILDARPAVRAALSDIEASVPADTIGTRMRMGLGGAVAEATARLADRHATRTVGLSGDAFEDDLLRSLTAEALKGAGLRVLSPRRVPGEDRGVSFGQAVVAAALGAGRS
jgi:hydrogenase maturation protein HypF